MEKQKTKRKFDIMRTPEWGIIKTSYPEKVERNLTNGRNQIKQEYTDWLNLIRKEINNAVQEFINLESISPPKAKAMGIRNGRTI